MRNESHPPRDLIVDIWPGRLNNSVDITMDRVDPAIKQQAMHHDIAELFAITTRISNYGERMGLRPASMLNLAIHVFRTNVSVELAALHNRLSTITSLNEVLSLVFSTNDQVTRYVTRASRPRRYDREDAGTFLVRSLTCYVTVSWSVQLPDVLRGIVEALPLNLWEDVAPTLLDELRRLRDRPELSLLGKIYNRHVAHFRTLVEVEFDVTRRIHTMASRRAQGPGRTRDGAAEAGHFRKVESGRRDDYDRQAPRKIESGRRDDVRGQGRRKAESGTGPGRDRRGHELKRTLPRTDRPASATVSLSVESKEPTCYACGEKGHIAPSCPNPTKKADYGAKRKSPAGGFAKNRIK